MLTACFYSNMSQYISHYQGHKCRFHLTTSEVSAKLSFPSLQPTPATRCNFDFPPFNEKKLARDKQFSDFELQPASWRRTNLSFIKQNLLSPFCVFYFQSNTGPMCWVSNQALVFAHRITVSQCVCNSLYSLLDFLGSAAQKIQAWKSVWVGRLANPRPQKVHEEFWWDGAIILSSMSADRGTRPSLSRPAGVVSGSTEASGGPSHRSVCLLLTCLGEITLQSDQRRAREEAGWSCPIQALSGPSPLRTLLQAWGETRLRTYSVFPAGDATIISSCTSANGDLISHQQTSDTKAGYQQPVRTAERAEVLFLLQQN